MEKFPQFFVYDNIAIFSAELIPRFPTWVGLVNAVSPQVLSDELEPTDVVVTSVRSLEIIDFDHFESLVNVEGTCIIDNTRLIVVLDSSSDEVTIHMLDVITSALSEDLRMAFDIENEQELRKTIAVFVNFGFVNPRLDSETNQIIMEFHRRISPKTTFNKIERILASTKTDRFHISVSLPKTVAEVMAKTVSFMNEASGELSITNYDEQGEAVLGINSNNVFEGTKGDTQLPQGLFSFHSHPDHITSEYNNYTAWPSGQDMRTIAGSFFTSNPVLAHFVVSPEGIWTVHPTFEFQKMTQSVFTERCATVLLDEIFTVFARFEIGRGKENVSADVRHKTVEFFLQKSNDLKLSDLLAKSHELASSCSFQEDARLFSVSFHKWKAFENGNLSFLFDYMRNDSVGLTSFIAPTESFLNSRIEKLQIDD